jgi:hypothetical protein
MTVAIAQTPANVDPGPRPELAWLPVAMLSVDPAYQRTIEGRVSQAAIGRIVAEFRWSCFGVVMVAAVDGGGDGWVIIDGQHRVEAARRCKLSTVPCIIVPASTRDEQAKIFLATNRLRVTVNAYAMHHAQLAAGEQIALDTQALADSAGISIPRYPIPRDRLTPGQTLALAMIKSATLNAFGTRAVRLVGAAWMGKPGGIPAGVIRAVWLALEERIPEFQIRAWLDRNQAADTAGPISAARIGEFVASMRRAPAMARVSSLNDPARLMGAR